jgi:hypothetical protein
MLTLFAKLIGLITEITGAVMSDDIYGFLIVLGTINLVQLLILWSILERQVRKERVAENKESYFYYREG